MVHSIGTQWRGPPDWDEMLVLSSLVSTSQRVAVEKARNKEDTSGGYFLDSQSRDTCHTSWHTCSTQISPTVFQVRIYSHLAEKHADAWEAHW